MTGFDLGEAAPDADEDTLTKQTEERERDEAEGVAVDDQEATDVHTTADSTPAMEAADEDGDSEGTDPLSEPAFPYEDVLQRPLYARRESREDLEQLTELELPMIFRKHGAKDVLSREIHDAIIQLALERPTEVARIVIEARGGEFDEVAAEQVMELASSMDEEN